jgi:hypothetical protein
MTKAICAFLLCLSFIACKKDQTENNSCVDDARTAYYLDFWKTEFLKRNSMSPTYFDAHISQIEPSANCWNSGITFRVSYRVTIDWAEIDNYDEFIVKLYPSDAYKYLNIPRDTFLDASQMQVILDKEIWFSAIGPVNPITSLKYGSYNDAVKAFRDSVKSGVIFPDRISYFVPGHLPRKNGNPFFLGSGTIDRSLKRCIQGNFDLATGKSSADTTACVMN